MAYQRVPETAEIRVIYSVSGRDVSNIFYADFTGGYNQAGLDTLSAAVDANGVPGFKVLLSERDEYLRTVVRGLNTEFDLTSENNFNAGAGSNATRPIPRQNSFAVSQLSGKTGRSARGRIYICGLTQGDIQDSPDNESKMKVVNADAYLAVCDGMRIAIDNAGVWDPVLVSRFHEGSKRAEAIVFDWATTVYRTLAVATRRDRAD